MVKLYGNIRKTYILLCTEKETKRHLDEVREKLWIFCGVVKNSGTLVCRRSGGCRLSQKTVLDLSFKPIWTQSTDEVRLNYTNLLLSDIPSGEIPKLIRTRDSFPKLISFTYRNDGVSLSTNKGSRWWLIVNTGFISVRTMDS